MKRIEYTVIDERYICSKEFTYYSKRYDKNVIVKRGYDSDGATGAKDIRSNSWWVHDVLSEYNQFSDGSHCSILQSSWVLHDILKEEGRYIRAKTWLVATFIGRHAYTLWSKFKG